MSEITENGSPEVDSGEPTPENLTAGIVNDVVEGLTPDEEVEFRITPEEVEFRRKRDAIAEALKDEEKFRQAIAELYIFMSNMDMAIRSIGAMGGPKAMMKMLMGRSGKDDES